MWADEDALPKVDDEVYEDERTEEVEVVVEEEEEDDGLRNLRPRS